MKNASHFVCCWLLTGILAVYPILARHPDMDKNVIQLITSHGYPVEDYTILSPGGYFLSLQRIPCSRKNINCDARKRPPVLLQHGILETSEIWVLNGPKRSLGFILADAGYDVWMGNARGNRLSRRHTTLGPENLDFWDFSYHEMGTQDLSATVDFILKITGQLKIFYVGFSMGTTMAYILLSEKPQYNNKFLKDPKAHGEFLPRSLLPPETCVMPLMKHACIHTYEIFSGYNPAELDESRLDVYYAHFPAGTSRKAVTHYTQSYYSDIFRRFDYGYDGNLRMYGQADPPKYNLSNVRAPTVSFYGENDWVNGPNKVLEDSAHLPNLVALYKVSDPLWGHMDFDNAINANQLVYQKALKVMKSF